MILLFIPNTAEGIGESASNPIPVSVGTTNISVTTPSTFVSFTLGTSQPYSVSIDLGFNNMDFVLYDSDGNPIFEDIHFFDPMITFADERTNPASNVVVEIIPGTGSAGDYDLTIVRNSAEDIDVRLISLGDEKSEFAEGFGDFRYAIFLQNDADYEFSISGPDNTDFDIDIYNFSDEYLDGASGSSYPDRVVINTEYEGWYLVEIDNFGDGGNFSFKVADFTPEEQTEFIITIGIWIGITIIALVIIDRYLGNKNAKLEVLK